MARLSLVVDPSGAERGYRQAERAGERYQRSARGVVGATNRINGAFGRLTSAAFSLKGALAGIGAGLVIRQVFSTFAEFERQLVEVGKTTDLEGERLQQLGERIQGIAREVPVATSRLQQLAVAAGQLGVTGVENVANFTETLGKLETATDIQGEQGARSLARLLNITGESTDAIDNLGSAITALGNNLATTEQEITQTATFLGSSTAQFDLTTQEVIALSGGLRALGQRAETSGSAVGAAFVEIESALNEGGEAMDTLTRITGQTAAELRTNFQENATSVLLDFTDALGDLESSEVTSVLDEFNLAGRETSRVINAMASDTDMLRDALEMANTEWTRNEALNIEAARAADTFSAQMRFLGNALNEVAVDIGRELAPIVLDLAQDFRDMIEAASDAGSIEAFFEDAASGARVFLSELEKIARVLLAIGGTLQGTALGHRLGGRFGAAAGGVAGGVAGFYSIEGLSQLSNLMGDGSGGGGGTGGGSGGTGLPEGRRITREGELGPITSNAEFQRAQDRRTLRQMGIGDIQVGPEISIDRLERTSELMGEREQLLQRIQTPQQRYNEQQSKLNEMLDHGVINQSQFNQAMEQAQDELTRTNETTRQLGFTFSSAFEDAIVQGENLRGVLQGLAEDVQRIILRQAVTEPMGNALASGISTFASGIFSGGGGINNTGITVGNAAPRANGGPVNSGGTYLVGERGPELLHMGRNGGSVTPNNQIGAAPEIHIHTDQEARVERTETRRGADGRQQVHAWVVREVKDGMNNGEFDRQMQGNFGVSRRGGR